MSESQNLSYLAEIQPEHEYVQVFDELGKDLDF